MWDIINKHYFNDHHNNPLHKCIIQKCFHEIIPIGDYCYYMQYIDLHIYNNKISINQLLWQTYFTQPILFK